MLIALELAVESVMYFVRAYLEVGVKTQSGFVCLEPVLMLGVLTNFHMSNVTMGATMVGLSLLALICQTQRKVAKSVIR